MLEKERIKASFFFTGAFYRNTGFKPVIKRLKADGNYLGAHGDQHLLYADWTRRDSTLVSEGQFKGDLQANYRAMARYGINKKQAPLFLPAFEWYNADIVRWTADMGLQLINFSPGTRSAADYTYPEMGKAYLNSEGVYQSILQYEAAHGLNGFMLISHIGTDRRRTDKFYRRLPELIRELKGRGYRFVTVRDMVKE